MAKKLQEALVKRQFENVYICMKCNAKKRTTRQKVLLKKARCRKCGSKALRLRAKEKRGQGK